MKPQTLQTAAMFAAVAVSGVIAWQVVKKGKTLAAAAGDALQPINPANPGNVVNQAVNGTLQAVTGSLDTLGTWIHRGVEAVTGGAYDPNAPARSAADIPTARVWTNAVDAEDWDIGAAMTAARENLPLWTVTDADDAEAGRWNMTNTLGGAALNYRTAAPYKRAKGN